MSKCAVCGGSLQEKRRDAVYCTAACKQFAHRKRKKEQISVPVPAVITVHDVGKVRPQRERWEAPVPPAPFLG